VRVLGEDVEDQRRAVDDARIDQLFQVALLRRRQFIIDDHQVKIKFFAQRAQFLRSPLANIGYRIGMTQTLDQRPGNIRSSRARQRPQLADRVFRAPHAVLLVAFNRDQIGMFGRSYQTVLNRLLALRRKLVPPLCAFFGINVYMGILADDMWGRNTLRPAHYDKCHAILMIVFTTAFTSASLYLNHQKEM